MKKLTLILTLLTIISTCSFGQHATDTISMKKVPGGYQFYQGAQVDHQRAYCNDQT
ncbi:hypothetical protein [Lentimicrobium sp.]|uniref:hypothetical protein n=1 Tax=Lentimicrobium sp. TaxID=2034841 RepID=UPI0025D59009|nr:hypothetical protein [Lentimicrobium sp.]